MALVFFSLFAFLFVAAAAAIDVDTAGWLLRVGACSVEDINGGATRAFLDDDGAAASSSAADGSSSAPPPVTLSRVRLLQNVLHAALQQHPLRSDDEHFVASLEIAGAVLSPDNDAGYGVAEEAADETINTTTTAATTTTTTTTISITTTTKKKKKISCSTI